MANAKLKSPDEKTKSLKRPASHRAIFRTYNRAHKRRRRYPSGQTIGGEALRETDPKAWPRRENEQP